MTPLFRLFFLSLALGAIGAGSGFAQAGSGGASLGIRLLPGDLVRLEVQDEPDLAGEYAIDTDGMVLFPLLGLVAVADRPFDEVRKEVGEAYGKQLTRAEIRLTPVLRVAVLGEVRQPGLVPVDPTYSLADVVAQAGGLTPSADRESISVLRDGATLVTLSEEDLSGQALVLRSGDLVQVGRRTWLGENIAVVIGSGASVLAAILTALILR